MKFYSSEQTEILTIKLQLVYVLILSAIILKAILVFLSLKVQIRLKTFFC
jgi:hypothetical protein